jgi:hypothetical protein
MKFMVNDFGIAESRIEIDGKGQTEPLSSNNTPEGKAKNRRVEFLKVGAAGTTQVSVFEGGDIVGVWEIRNPNRGATMTYEFTSDGKLKLGTSAGILKAPTKLTATN